LCWCCCLLELQQLLSTLTVSFAWLYMHEDSKDGLQEIEKMKAWFGLCFPFPERI
jgi:hypothetical protein